MTIYSFIVTLHQNHFVFSHYTYNVIVFSHIHTLQSSHHHLTPSRPHHVVQRVHPRHRHRFFFSHICTLQSSHHLLIITSPPHTLSSPSRRAACPSPPPPPLLLLSYLHITVFSSSSHHHITTSHPLVPITSCSVSIPATATAPCGRSATADSTRRVWGSPRTRRGSDCDCGGHDGW